MVASGSSRRRNRPQNGAHSGAVLARNGGQTVPTGAIYGAIQLASKRVQIASLCTELANFEADTRPPRKAKNPEKLGVFGAGTQRFTVLIAVSCHSAEGGTRTHTSFGDNGF